jgi:tRNA(Ile)-lysidine synthase
MESLMKLTAEYVRQFIPSCNSIFVAFSGGADSTALLHLLSQYKQFKSKMTAIHVNHGLQMDSDQWQAHCQTICKDLGVNYQPITVKLSSKSEEIGRKARYEAFNSLMKDGDVLVTAHHKEDHFETILMSLFRGTGLGGLRGISNSSSFGSGVLIRPLLEFSKSDLTEYLNKHDVSWVEDPSNMESDFTRNYLRNEITPLIMKQWPQAVESVSKLSQNAKDSFDLMTHLLQLNHQSHTLSLSLLKSLPKELRATVIYHWLSLKNIPLPGQKSLQSMAQSFCTDNYNALPQFKTKSYDIVAWKGAMHCLIKMDDSELNQSFQWNGEEDFDIAHGLGSISYAGDRPGNFVVKFSQFSEKIALRHHQNRKSVKNLFQETETPPWLRPLIPFIYDDSNLVYVGIPGLSGQINTNFVTQFKKIQI